MDDTCEQVILNAFNEDIVDSVDLTTDCIIQENHESQFQLVINEDAVLAGFKLFKNTFCKLDKNITIGTNFSDGSKLRKKETVACVSGNTKAILKGERTALNFICHLSGIATLTSNLKDKIKHTRTILLDTRKTTPTLRALEKEAVVSGGGQNHRFNLSQMVLIKDNHIDAAGGVGKAILCAKECYNSRFKIEVEVRDLKELNEAIASKPDIIMFDNWDLQDLRKGVKLVPADILTEASGQINETNIKDYAEAEVNYISTSYMIKNAKWIDFSLKVVK